MQRYKDLSNFVSAKAGFRVMLVACLLALSSLIGCAGAGISASAPAAPTVTAFAASPANINAGASSTLSWAVNGATSVTLTGVTGQATSPVTVTPSATTTYTLTASNAVGSVTATVTVTVVSPPVISSLTASPSVVPLGQSSILSWSVSGATSITLTGVTGQATSPVTVTPSATTTYTLTASNAAGMESASLTITVVSLPVISSFAASPSSVPLGQSSKLSWSVSGATSVTLTGVTGQATSPVTVTPSATTTYTLTASNIAGSVSATATVTVTLPVIVTISPTTVTLGSGATQAFTATVANDSANGGVTWSIGTSAGSLSSATTTDVTYNAPAGLPGTETASLTATSKTDPTKSASATITLSAPTSPASQWVYYDSSGNLAYKPLNAQGDQIMDFSTAGYMQGGTALPTAPVAANVSPSGGDDTTNIQAAINTVSAMTLNTTTGLRGAVLLAPGNYKVSGSLTISVSGVVLRGSGSGATGGTVITMSAATTPYPLVVIAGSGSSASAGSSTAITDSYVPSGTLTLHVASTSGLAIGTNVIVQRPVTSAWVTYMGMTSNDLGSGNTWIAVGNSGLKTERTITAINGTQITLDAPMTDSIDSTYCGVSGGTLYPYTFAGRISQVGVENFRAIAPAVIGVVGDPTYQLVTTTAVINAWIRNLAAQDTLQSVNIGSESKQVTVSNIAITHTITQTGSSQFEEFYIAQGTQILMDTVSDTADDMYFFATSSETQGPNVLRNASFAGDMTIEPHQRWATGLLVENTTVNRGASSQGGINFWDRGTYGTGHGWTIGWGVVWNSTGGKMIIQQPPGSENWCIGCIGTQVTKAAPGGTVVLPQGAIDSPGAYVFPTSLYQAQLTQRLGPGVVAQ
ncbi:MAG TPA: hypothetical protein VGB94_08045 [Acidobacteriaceae bacterium]